MNTEQSRGGVGPRLEEIRETKPGRGQQLGAKSGGRRPEGQGRVWSSRPRTAPDPPRHTRRGPLGLRKGGPLPMCCVSSCTAGISFRGMCPVPPSLQHRRQQNTEAAMAPGPLTPPRSPAARRPWTAATPPPRLRSASRPRPSAGVCVERADRYSDAPRREGAAQAVVQPARDGRCRGCARGEGRGPRRRAWLEAERGQRA